MRNQFGFAALEIILVMAIISLLATVALPKMTKFLDTANLNYEVKKFYSEFLFAKSVSRSSNYYATIFSGAPISNGKGINFSLFDDNYQILYSYTPICETNFFPKNFKIYCPSNLRTVPLSQGRLNKAVSGTYVFTSPLNNRRYIKLDSVGRIRIDDEEN